MTYYPMGAMAAPQYVPMGWFGDAVSRSAPVIGGTLGGITSALTKNPALGGFVGGVTNMVARDYGHLIPFQAGPQMMQAPAGYAPQGMWGNLISGAGNIVGGLVGGNAGRVIQDASGLARFLPFEAGPQMAPGQMAYAPQGAFGNFVRDVAPVVGQHVGGNWGRVISTVGSLGDLLPFQAGPQMAYAPQGAFGNFVRDVAPVVGQHVGGNWGRVISTVGSLGDLLPFEAGPQMVPGQMAYAPQGMWGNLIAGAGNLAGNIVGGKTGRTISAVSGLGRYLPFEAGPGQIAYAPEEAFAQPLGGDPNAGAEPMIAVTDGAGQVAYVPQGIWGSLIAGAGQLAGGIVGGKTGRVIRDVSSLGNLLPFAVGPQQMAYAPQGMWGNLISGAGNIVGGLVGGNAGRVIQDASGLARFLPFEAGPQMAPVYQQAPMPQQAYAPQGFLGGLGGSILGGAIGGAFGRRDLGSAIGGIAGSFLPFQAGPMTNGYLPGDAIVYH